MRIYRYQAGLLGFAIVSRDFGQNQDTSLIGIAIAFCGAAIVITRGDPVSALHDLSQSIGPGEGFMLCAVASSAAYTIRGSQLVLSYLRLLRAFVGILAWTLLPSCKADLGIDFLHGVTKMKPYV